ncbi:hypothetical protein GLI01_07190 [Gluconacetobacter liquefaciens]|nr:hypothetical protein GLI01_07190 [Gluconacetobacter liquefaciens]
MIRYLSKAGGGVLDGIFDRLCHCCFWCRYAYSDGNGSKGGRVWPQAAKRAILRARLDMADILVDFLHLARIVV